MNSHLVQIAWLLCWPAIIFVSYKLSFWLIKKWEAKNSVNE